MDFKTFTLVIVSLILIEGFVAIILSHGINGHYYKTSKNLGEAMKKLRAEKPRTAKVIAACYLLMLLEFILLAAIKLGR